MHKGPLVLVCVSQKTDIDEMKKYLDNVNNMVIDQANQKQNDMNMSHDYENQQSDTFQEYNADELYEWLGKATTQFTTEWNNNTENRSKAA